MAKRAAAAQQVEDVDIPEAPELEAKVEKPATSTEVMEVEGDEELAALLAENAKEEASAPAVKDQSHAEPQKPEKEEQEPKPQPQPVREKLPPAAREERNKRKRWQAVAKAATEQAQTLQDRIRQLETAGVVLPPLDTKRLEEIKREADAASDMGKVVDLIVDFTDKRYLQLRAAERENDLKLKVAKSEVRARETYGEAEYDKRLRDSGVEAGVRITNGQYANPRMAFEIFTADDPAEAAFQIATEILKGQGKMLDKVEEPGEELLPSGEVKGGKREEEPEPAAATKQAAKPAPKPAATPARPRGINDLPAADGPSKGTFTREDLDRLSTRNPKAYQALIERRPEIGDWHLGKE